MLAAAHTAPGIDTVEESLVILLGHHIAKKPIGFGMIYHTRRLMPKTKPQDNINMLRDRDTLASPLNTTVLCIKGIFTLHHYPNLMFKIKKIIPTNRNFAGILSYSVHGIVTGSSAHGMQ